METTAEATKGFFAKYWWVILIAILIGWAIWYFFIRENPVVTNTTPITGGLASVNTTTSPSELPSGTVPHRM